MFAPSATNAVIINEFTITADISSPNDIVAGPDGNLWVTEPAINGNKIGRITPAGAITEFAIPDAPIRYSGP